MIFGHRFRQKTTWYPSLTSSLLETRSYPMSLRTQRVTMTLGARDVEEGFPNKEHRTRELARGKESPDQAGDAVSSHNATAIPGERKRIWRELHCKRAGQRKLTVPRQDAADQCGASETTQTLTCRLAALLPLNQIKTTHKGGRGVYVCTGWRYSGRKDPRATPLHLLTMHAGEMKRH